MNSYDSLPYDSSPIAETHPGQLATMAALFGMQAAHPERCRVLELGCASGGNLIPLAFYQPESQFVGLERSPVQTRAGQALIERLALRNVTLSEGDILDFAWNGEPFDYIIAHGVFSWAPEAVREKIFEIAARHLAPGGIAYLSYNTLPGWRLRGMLRDALRHAASGVSAPGEQLARARRQLEALSEAFSGMDTHAAKHLAAEIARLRTRPDSYLYHEYLEDVNVPFLFSDFAVLARRHGFVYLTDASPEWLLPDALPNPAVAWLRAIGDRMEREQQLDFLISRSFRRSLLVRAGTNPHGPQFEALASLALYSSARPRKDLRLNRPLRVEFALPDGNKAEVEHPLTKAALAHLAAVYPDSLAFTRLAEIARQTVVTAGGQRYAEQQEQLFGELAGLFLHQAVMATPAARAWPRMAQRVAEDKPRANALARVLAETGATHLATPRHGAFPIGDAERRMISRMDGQHGVEDIARAAGISRAGTEKTIAAFSYQGLTI
jgi:SAM-dependent methyltransferase